MCEKNSRLSKREGYHQMSTIEDLVAALSDLEDLKLKAGEGWLEIGIARPEKRNALREQTAREILRTLDAVEQAPEVRAVILHGIGEHFCAGVDTSAFSMPKGGAYEQWRLRRTTRQISRLYRTLPEFTKPLLVAIEGYALGGGFEIALMADLVVAAHNAQLGLTEVKLGMLPGGGGTQTLARVVGRAKAKQLIWTGKRISAKEAEALGIVVDVAEQGCALDTARAMTREICAQAPLAVMFAKSLIDQGVDMTLRQGWFQEGDLSFALSFSEDRKEGLAAFAEKRKPNFSSR